MNKCMAEIQGPGVFEPGTLRRKANAIKRILPNAAVRYCISTGMQPWLKEWSPVTYPLLKSSFIDDKNPYLVGSPFSDIKWD